MFPGKVWRDIPRRYRLEAARCKKCGKIFFPARLVCDCCKARDFEKLNLPWEGTLVTFSVIHVPPAGFSDQTPYGAGIVEVMDGVRITCQIVDMKPEELKIGQKLKLEFRLIQRGSSQDVLCYGYKAVPYREEIHGHK